MLSRTAMMRWRERLLTFGKGAKMALGALLIAVGVAILTHADKSLEAALVSASPEWLTRLTTQF
jgi:cytochrome c-type biogenesis protein